VKILFVAEDWAWPSTGGGLLRLARMIEALSEMGDLDLFALHDPARETLALPEDVSVRRYLQMIHPHYPSERTWRWAWMRQRSLPMEVVRGSYDVELRQTFASWVADDYDVVWFSTAALYGWLGRPRLGPTIIDYMDLEDTKADQRAELLDEQRRHEGVRAKVRTTVAMHQAKKNASGWRAYQRAVGAEVERVVLCSESDVARSGLPNAVSIANTYVRPDHPVGRRDVSEEPVALLQGSLNYEPNVDGAKWLIRDIAPALRAKVPGLQIRLVGKAPPAVQRMHHPPAVTVVGRVPDILPELARADIALVPLRIGSGTRLKILESFAHRIPVVSTTVGADGLDVKDGVHLLIADDPESFATACQRLLEDADLRRRMVDAAEELYLARYEWATTKVHLQRLVRSVAAGTAAS